jgi:3-hydroxyacyl-CoA dehydrogenase
MGGGIAMNYANAGIPVLLKESDQAALDRGLATIRKNYDISASKGKMTPEQVDRVMSLIRPTLTYDGFDQVDIVVEAVFENLDLKKSVFADLGRVTRPDCVLASNTSTLDIDQFAQSSGRPANVIGHHFFSPANVMKLMEIVRGRESSNQTIATSLKLSKKLNKVGVVVGNCFGFVANRMLAYYMREGYLLLEEGASVPQIDQSDDQLRHAGGAVRHAGYRGHRRGRAHPPVSALDRRQPRRRAGIAGARLALRDGPLRPEDRRGMVSL